MLQTGVAGQKQAVIQHDGVIPILQIDEKNEAVGGFQHQGSGSGVLWLDGALSRDLTTDGFSEEIAYPFDSGIAADVAHHPRHGPGLKGDVGLGHIADHLTPADVHGRRKVSGLGAGGRDA